MLPICAHCKNIRDDEGGWSHGICPDIVSIPFAENGSVAKFGKYRCIPAPLIAHILQAPMLSQRFSPVVVSTMQKKGILDVTSGYVIALEQNS
jgi:hypothetical protein